MFWQFLIHPVAGDQPDYDHWVVYSVGPKNNNAHQGIIARDDGYTLIDDNRFTRYNIDWVQQAVNTDPRGDLGTTGNMIDCFEHDGFIRTVRTRNDTTDYIEAWNADTLVYDATESVAFTAGPNFVGFSTCCAGPTSGYLYGVDQDANYIQVHDMSDGSHVEDITVVGSTMSQCNGIHYKSGYFYFAERNDKLYRCLADGTGLELIKTFGETGMDGMSGKANDLYVLMNGSWDGVWGMRGFWDEVQTTGKTSGEIIVNGDFETNDFSGGWQVWPGSGGYDIIFGGAIGATPDSYIAHSLGTSFMFQCYLIPQEAWDSVDAGTATVDFAYTQFGSSSGSGAVTCFDDAWGQLGQYGYSPTSVGWSGWSDRGITAQTLPVGTRMILFQFNSNGTSVYYDDVSASISW